MKNLKYFNLCWILFLSLGLSLTFSGCFHSDDEEDATVEDGGGDGGGGDVNACSFDLGYIEEEYDEGVTATGSVCWEADPFSEEAEEQVNAKFDVMCAEGGGAVVSSCEDELGGESCGSFDVEVDGEVEGSIDVYLSDDFSIDTSGLDAAVLAGIVAGLDGMTLEEYLESALCNPPDDEDDE